MGKLKDDEYIFSVEDEKASITLNEGETLSSKIRVDCQKWLNEFADATFEVLVRFQGSRTFHVAAHTEIVENILTWKPDTNDTLKPGIGWWQVRCISGEEIVALTRKWEMCVLPSVHTTGVEEAVTKEYVDEALGKKQDTLTFDDTPTVDSDNPVTSGGVKAALDEITKQAVLDLKIEMNHEESGRTVPTVTYADGATVVPGLTVEDFVNGDVRVNFTTLGSESPMPAIYCSAMPTRTSIAIQFAMPAEGVGFIGFNYDPQTGNVSNGYMVQLAPYEVVDPIRHWISDYKYSNFHKNEYCINGSNFVKRISDNANMGTKDTDYIYTNVGAELESLTNTIASLEARIAALEGN